MPSNSVTLALGTILDLLAQDKSLSLGWKIDALGGLEALDLGTASKVASC
jgi:hypothetical protein